MTIPAAPVGYLAASLVYATFCAKRMVPLRALAIASNLAFMAYGYLDALSPILILHSTLLPLNVLRLIQASDGSGSRPDHHPNASTRRTRQSRRPLARAIIWVLHHMRFPINASVSEHGSNKDPAPSLNANALRAARQQGGPTWPPSAEHRLAIVRAPRHAKHNRLSARVPTPAIVERCLPLAIRDSGCMPAAENAIAATTRRRNLIARAPQDAVRPSADD